MANGITLERDGAIARITLDRPDVGNAMDMAMARELMETAVLCAGDDGIRCVLVTGNGRLFCAGGDAFVFSTVVDQLSDFLTQITTYTHAALIALARMNKPLVVALNGPVAGGGIGLALLGDIVLADPTAHLTPAYPAIGLSPDCGASWLMPRLIGLRRAQELLLTNRRVGAEEAVAIGLYSRLVEPGTVVEEAVKVARQLAESATSSLGTARRLLLDSYNHDFETHVSLESRLMAEQARTPEGREGVAAFIEKRPPRFT